ncbi:MAG: hypothetical protein KDD62_14320, partial [Bdellovibrionales bacterium]|nr:hypothetical protein [Bdellovibrionales bacterium]
MTTEPTNIVFSWKHKLLLISFGLVFGAGFLGIAWKLYQPDKRGVEFANLQDLRRAMLSPEAEEVNSSGSVPLGAIVTPHPDDQIIYDL